LSSLELRRQRCEHFDGLQEEIMVLAVPSRLKSQGW
jgi:hypothetical protein